MLRFILIGIALTGALVSPAFAHTGLGPANSFAFGVAHPLNGMDHILAMIAVGLWGVVAGGRAIWVWPAAFVATLLAGFAAATLGVQIPFVEPVIASSIVVLGLLVALTVKAPVWLGAVVVGLFAFFHGHAHGTEATTTGLIPYAAGFALATAVLHVAGIALGVLAKASIGTAAFRAVGGLAALGGVALFAGLA
jgi:urease accessory protein